MFADDTIAYLASKSKWWDNRFLEDDLNRLADLETQWQMGFHAVKCEIIHISHKKTTIQSNYVLHGHTLKSVDAAKYLGGTITKDLKWNTHIESTKTKVQGLQDTSKTNGVMFGNHLGSIYQGHHQQNSHATHHAVKNCQWTGCCTYIAPPKLITRSSRLCHPAGYLVPRSTSDYHRSSFFSRTI